MHNARMRLGKYACFRTEKLSLAAEVEPQKYAVCAHAMHGRSGRQVHPHRDASISDYASAQFPQTSASSGVQMLQYVALTCASVQGPRHDDNRVQGTTQAK